jgi:hypothetical protein
VRRKTANNQSINLPSNAVDYGGRFASHCKLMFFFFFVILSRKGNKMMHQNITTNCKVAKISNQTVNRQKKQSSDSKQRQSNKKTKKQKV